MARPLKPSTSIDEEIELLHNRGMDVNVDEARQWLSAVGYYRLSAYWYPARITKADGSRDDQFQPDTTFSQAVGLYEADRKLRTLLHDGIERVEVGLRSRLSAHLCSNDPLGYRDPHFYRPQFNLNAWLARVQKRVERGLGYNSAIRHYYDTYDGHYPLWVLSEVLDFADISRLYQGLRYQEQDGIAQDLNISIDLGSLSRDTRRKVFRKHPLAVWFEQLTVVRNTCAHHSRVWNKSFVPASTAHLRPIGALQGLPEGQSERIYGAIIMIAFLLETFSPKSTWKQKVHTLINQEFLTSPLVSPQSLGLLPLDPHGDNLMD